MSGSRRFGGCVRAAGVSLGVAGLVAVTACTGGDDGDALVVDGDAAATIAAAVEHARSSSGRYETSFRETLDGEGVSEETSDDLLATGEFSSVARRSTLDQVISPSESPLDVRTETLVVGGRTYGSTGQLRAREEMYEPTDAGAIDSSGYVDTGSDRDFRALDGKDWADITPLVEGDRELVATVDPSVPFALVGYVSDDPFALLDVVTDVQEVAGTEIDGGAVRTFSATVPSDQLMSLVINQAYLGPVGFPAVGADPTVDEEYERRQAAVDEYLDAHTTVRAELYLGDGEQLRRVVVTAITTIEDEYEDCSPMSSPGDEFTMTTDFADLGAEIDISEPDPATVISFEELATAFPNTWSEGLEGDGFAVADASAPVQTVDGPRERAAVVNDLSKYGYLIGLVPDPWISDPDRTTMPDEHASSATVASLSDEELVAKYAEADAALAGMDRTTTALGDLTRPELLWNVKVGMSNLGVDLSVADAMSDQQLGQLIDGYVVENGWIVGDGVWGDMSQELMDSFHDQSGSENEMSVDVDSQDPWAGCPG